ncbi:MAG: DNA methyltransferase [Minisyncoccales bacterium]
MTKITKPKLNIVYVPIDSLRPSEYNPRKISNESMEQLKESIKRFQMVDPVIANIAPSRKNIVIGGHMRLRAAKELKFKEIPVVYVNISDIEREKELNIRLNKNTGDWDWNLLANFDEDFLSGIGFNSEELDEVFGIDENPEIFDLQKELRKLGIQKIDIKKGDVYKVGPFVKIMCGDSTIENDVFKLMGKEKADMCLTDPPYILNYLQGKKKHGKAIEGFGYKRDRRYLETDFLPPDFTQKWMANISKIAKPDFSIIVYENWKNIRTVWGEMEKHWKVKNMIVWNTPNRTQGFSAKYKFFSKYDIAMVGKSGNKELSCESENELLQNEYETALYAISGKPHWEGYKKGKKICPSDFIQFKVDDAKHSGQGIIFGTKPLPILIPYLKVLTKRGDLIIDPFGGSGSTAAAALTMERRCFVMEKSPIYTAVIRCRIEKLTGRNAKKL